MPTTYESDVARRRVLVTVRGPFEFSDVTEVLERQRQDGSWSYGMLCDLRGMVGGFSFAELHRVKGALQVTPHGEAARGPLALVVTDSALYAMACVYELLQKPRRRVHVVRNVDEADRWLTVHTPASTK